MFKVFPITLFLIFSYAICMTTPQSKIEDFKTAQEQLFDKNISDKEPIFEGLEKLINDNTNLQNIAKLALKFIKEEKPSPPNYASTLWTLEKIVEKGQGFKPAKTAVISSWENDDQIIHTRVLALLNSLVSHNQLTQFAQNKALEILDNPKSNETNLLNTLWILKNLVIKKAATKSEQIISNLINMITNEKTSVSIKIACLDLIREFINQKIGTKQIFQMIENNIEKNISWNIKCKLLQILAEIVKQGKYYESAKTIADKALNENNINIKINAMRVYRALAEKKKFQELAIETAEKQINKMSLREEAIKILTTLVQNKKYLDEAEKLIPDEKRINKLTEDEKVAIAKLYSALLKENKSITKALTFLQKTQAESPILIYNPALLSLDLDINEKLLANPKKYASDIQKIIDKYLPLKENADISATEKYFQNMPIKNQTTLRQLINKENFLDFLLMSLGISIDKNTSADSRAVQSIPEGFAKPSRIQTKD